MKKILLTATAVLLSSCAQMNWTHPSKTEAQFRSDMAYCQNEAMRNVQQQAPVYVPTAPIYTPPQQYDTNCSRTGNYVNCSTTAQPNISAQIAQQNAINAQNQAAAYANIGTGIERGNYADNCMYGMGYTKQKVNQQPAVNTQNSRRDPFSEDYKRGLAEMQPGFNSDACNNPVFRDLLTKSPCAIKDIGLAHLSSTDKITKDEKSLLDEYSKVQSTYQNKEMDLILRTIQSPFREELLEQKRLQVKNLLDLKLELYTEKINWGEYNQKRKELADKVRKEREQFLNRYSK